MLLVSNRLATLNSVCLLLLFSITVSISIRNIIISMIISSLEEWCHECPCSQPTLALLRVFSLEGENTHIWRPVGSPQYWEEPVEMQGSEFENVRVKIWQYIEYYGPIIYIVWLTCWLIIHIPWVGWLLQHFKLGPVKALTELNCKTSFNCAVLYLWGRTESLAN